ncbi:PEP-CTERM sorting domain-containing protein [Thalassotalea algicola]|uniref:PEP-CTERM sorting domain-containing protein n=1 Tax=Thalassotalea algicola TaxID=2716224 RepID=UPI001F2C8609|nr:PEP-CTERM sorting domain-containing protein [Thalassotalea algicola]
MKLAVFKAAVAGLFLSLSSFASAGLIVDVQDFSNNTATEYFVDVDGNKTNTPYYRGSNQDWGWVHDAIAGTFTSIILDVSGYDIDFAQGEFDQISVFDGASWVDLGNLTGTDSTWTFTQFDLSGFAWANAQVNAGLQVRMDIDTTGSGWLVTLGKSVLSVDDGLGGGGSGSGCVPTPGIPCVDVPEPSTLAIFALGFMGLASRRFKKL